MISEKLVNHAYFSDNLLDLTQICNSNVNICMVKRTVSNKLETFIEHLLSESRALNVIENIHVKTFDAQKFLPSQFYHVEGCAELDKAMCPKFHVDHVPCRLVCTYGGIGTEFLKDAFVNRAKLGSGSGGLSDDVSGLIKGDMDTISTMPAYAIGLLKGSHWEGNEQNGAVHRSPKLTQHSPRRLLLTLDFA